MKTPDAFYLALIALLLLTDHFVLWSGILRLSRAGSDQARVPRWSGWIVVLWPLHRGARDDGHRTGAHRLAGVV